MPVPAVALAGAGFATVVTSWVTYMATVPSGKVPLRPYRHFAVQAVGAGLAITGIATGATAGGALLPTLVAAPALTLAGLFGWLYSQRATPVGRLQVAIGDAVRPFTALTPEGDTFDVASLRGRRVLLKFFRGHW